MKQCSSLPASKVQSLSAVFWQPRAFFPTHIVSFTYTAYSLLPPKGWKRMHTPAQKIYTHWLTQNIPYVHFPKHHTSPCCVSYSTSITTCSSLCPPHHPTSWIYSNSKVTALLRRRKSLWFSLEIHDARLSQCKCPFAAPSSTELQVSISSNSCSLHAGRKHNLGAHTKSVSVPESKHASGLLSQVSRSLV